MTSTMLLMAVVSIIQTCAGYVKAQESLIYSYNRSINGFAAKLEEEEADKLAKNPNVVSVSLHRRRELHTTHSWEFLGLESSQGLVNGGFAWVEAKYAEDTIIASLDTGVWQNPGVSVLKEWDLYHQNGVDNSNLEIMIQRNLSITGYFGFWQIGYGLSIEETVGTRINHTHTLLISSKVLFAILIKLHMNFFNVENYQTNLGCPHIYVIHVCV